MEYKNKRRLIFGISIVLFILFYFFKNTSTLLRIIATLAGLVIFYIYDYYFEANFRVQHYLFILFMAFFGILLSPLYFISENYDKILHLVMPIFVSGIVFFLVDKQKLSFKGKLFITFSITVASLAIFEIIEYILDTFWNFQLQGVYIRDITGLEKFDVIMDKNDDTMIDLMLGILGSIIFSFHKIGENWKNKRKK